MAVPATFQQVLAQCATAQAGLRKSLADAHEREISELSSRIRTVEAQLHEGQCNTGQWKIEEVRTCHKMPSLKSGLMDSDHKEKEQQKRETLEGSPAPCPPLNAKPASPSAWTEPPLLGVVPSEDVSTKMLDLPQEDSAEPTPAPKRCMKKQGTGFVAREDVSDSGDESDESDKSEEFVNKKESMTNGRSPVDKSASLVVKPQAWNNGRQDLMVAMHPQLVQASADQPRRVSWRDGCTAPSPRASFNGTMSSRRVSLRASLAAAPNMGASFIAADPMAAHYDEDGNVQAWPVWLDISEALEADRLTRPPEEAKPKNKSMTKGLFSHKTRNLKNLKSGDLLLREATDSCVATALQAMAIHPSSMRRLCWLMLAFGFIMYDVIMIPLSSFDLNINGLMLAMTWIVAVYWQLNLLVSFFMGYHESFKVELRFRKTALRYAKTWFPLDFMLVLLDWVVLIDNLVSGEDGDHTGNEARTARVAKGMYIMRALRVLRLARVAHLPSNLRETAFVFTRSEYMSLTLGIIKHMLFILIINHVIACVWYMIGKHSGWVAVYMDVLAQGDQWEMKYLTSLHWSLTQFTPASMTVQPTNLKERAFAVAVLLFALVSFSSFVSSITNLMNHLRTLKSAEAKQFSQLERYFHDHNISFGLSLRVRRYLEHYLIENKRRPREQDVQMIAMLSEHLRTEIHHEVFSPTLVKHPFFAHYLEFNLQGMRKLCHTALSTMRLSTDDVLFNGGETAKAMYFVSSGKFEYKRPGKIGDDVVPGEWICEMVLWRPWEHVGRTQATAESSSLALDVSSFHQIIINHKSPNKLAEEDLCNYALQAAKILSEKEVNDLTDLDDSDVLEARALAIEAFHEAVPTMNHGGKHAHGHFHVFNLLHRHRHSVESMRGSRNSGARRSHTFTEAKSGMSVHEATTEGSRWSGSHEDSSQPVTVHAGIEIVSPCRPATKK